MKSDSQTETFAAIKLYIDNWRWQGVPFYLRTGKRLPARTSEVSLQFRPVPHHPFPDTVIQPNRLAIQIEPQEGILLRTQVKEPGMVMQLKPVELHFTYQEVFHSKSPDAYETLLLDIIRGDSGLFMRSDQIEAAWSVLEPILNVWAATRPISQITGPANGDRRRPGGADRRGRPELAVAGVSGGSGRKGPGHDGRVSRLPDIVPRRGRTLRRTGRGLNRRAGSLPCRPVRGRDSASGLRPAGRGRLS